MKLTRGTAALGILQSLAAGGQHTPTLCSTVIIMMTMRSGMVMMRRALEMVMAPRRMMRVGMMMMGGAGAAS